MFLRHRFAVLSSLRALALPASTQGSLLIRQHWRYTRLCFTPLLLCLCLSPHCWPVSVVCHRQHHISSSSSSSRHLGRGKNADCGRKLRAFTLRVDVSGGQQDCIWTSAVLCTVSDDNSLPWYPPPPPCPARVDGWLQIWWCWAGSSDWRLCGQGASVGPQRERENLCPRVRLSSDPWLWMDCAPSVIFCSRSESFVEEDGGQGWDVFPIHFPFPLSPRLQVKSFTLLHVGRQWRDNVGGVRGPDEARCWWVDMTLW